MGSASCKSPKSSEQNSKKEDIKQITIGVFGLDNAGKTSTIKALEGAPTEHVIATVGSNTSMIPYPKAPKGNNKSQERIKIIDVSGERKFRERSWPNYYDQIHGFIFVIDASEKKRIMENKTTLDDLLEDDKLRNKPILILANKQDRKGAIKDEDDIKEKLQIEELKSKHKIELCTALPNDHNKTDESIRQGFSWLIRTIEANYTELNSRVNKSKNSNPPKPADRKSHLNKNQKNSKSDESDNDEDVVYAGKRTHSPIINKKNTDYRSSNTPIRIPPLDLNKSKKKTSGHETYSENDDDDDVIRSHSRPGIHLPQSDRTDRNRLSNQSNVSATSGFNKKKKVIGATSGNNDLPNKKPGINDPKSFRSTYEPFPEEAPWSSSSTKTTKNDNNILPKPYLRPSITNDLTKRSLSPLVHDTRLFNSGSLSKRNNASDDDDDLKYNDKSKSVYPPLNRFKDTENQKFPPPLSTTRPLSSTVKKPTSGIYGADYGDDDLKNNDIYRRPNLSTPITTTKKPYKHNDDSDNENDYLKKSTSKTSKSFGSDDDDKNYPRSTDRSRLNNDYRGTTSKPLPSPIITPSRSKSKEDSFPLPSAIFTKPSARPRFDDDDLPSISKPVNRSTFSNDNYLSSTLSKPKIRSTSDDDNDDRRPSPSSKPTTQSKYGNNDDDYKSISKPVARPKYDDNDDLPSSLSKFGTRSKYDNDYSSSSVSKPVIRLKNDDNDRPSSPLRSATRSKYDDDDLPSYSSKPTTRSKFDDDDDLPSKSKSPIRSKYNNDDDDDDDSPLSSSKTGTRSKYGDNNRSLSSAKPISRSKFDDDDYDDDRTVSSSKAPIRSKYGDDNRSFSPAKPTSRSKFEDDDDDDRPVPSSKAPSRSRFDDDDDDRPSRSKFDDDDYPSSSSKKNNYSSRDDDYSGSGGARSRYGNNDFDSAKNGSNNARIGSASNYRSRTNANFDS